MNLKAQVQFIQALIHAAHTYIYIVQIPLSIKKTKIPIFLEMYNLIQDVMKLPKMVCYTYMHCHGLQMLHI
jgi:hypothetical protein